MSINHLLPSSEIRENDRVVSNGSRPGNPVVHLARAEVGSFWVAGSSWVTQELVTQELPTSCTSLVYDKEHPKGSHRLTHINPLWHQLLCSECTDRLAGAAVCLGCHARKPGWRSHRTRRHLPRDGQGGHTWCNVGVDNVGADLRSYVHPITASEMHDVRMWGSAAKRTTGMN